MTISRLNPNLDPNEKLRQLNEMIMELSGKIDQAKFNKTELDAVYDILEGSGLNHDRKYLRNVALGNTVGTYSGWTHIKAFAGYSIWKYSPTNYEYSSLNQLYLDNILLTNLGEATSETATTFDKVFLYNGSTYTDNTTEAGTDTGTQFALMADTSSYLYLGLSTTFSGFALALQTRGSGYTLEFEYWNGSAWTELTYSGNTFVDETSNFESDGLISFDIPVDWATTTVNSVASKYWIRIKTTATPVTVSYVYSVRPGNSVVDLLTMDSNDIILGNWVWCSYLTSVYVALRNSGGSTKEGDYFITSSSSVNNLKNFFVYNHVISLDHLDSSFVA